MLSRWCHITTTRLECGWIEFVESYSFSFAEGQKLSTYKLQKLDRC